VKRAIKIGLATLGVAMGVGLGGTAHAGGISDTGVNAYWGSDDHNAGDVIGASTYDIQGATITRIGSVLTIAISTSFAGHAGMDSNIVAGGIGYGDVFLGDTWNPYGKDANHASDNASNGTIWDYGFSLDNRFSNTGGTFKLYSLNGSTNASNILNSGSFIKCATGVNCEYRNGQATAVNTGSSTVQYTGLTGSWSVAKDSSLTFKLDLGKSNLLNFDNFAMHWGETCQNDVIEGYTRAVPLPGSLPLTALGIVALIAIRRRRQV
jgi:hypothetical protein